MSEESFASFAQVLESLGVQPLTDTANFASEPPADTICLSVQAAKAIKQPLARNSFVEQAPISPKSDEQGNRVLLSPEARSLADSTGINTVWETVLEKRDKSA